MDTLVQIRLVGRTEQADFLASLLLGAGAQGLEVIDEDTMGQPTMKSVLSVSPNGGVNEALDPTKATAQRCPNTTVIDPSWRDAIERKSHVWPSFVINGCSATKGHERPLN